jgi:hypothetical protein
MLCAMAGVAGAQAPAPDGAVEPPNEIFQDGFETSACDTNPVCDGFTNLGEISGDTTTAPVGATATSERWYRVRVTEDSNEDVYLSATIVLTVPNGSDYDLYVYCESCGGALAGQSKLAGSATETVTVRADDEFGPFGEDDSFDLRIEVRHVSGLVCDTWSLQVVGDTTANSPTCP